MTISFDAILSRVRYSETVPAGTTASVDVERSLNGIRWTVVRGGKAIAAVAADVVSLDDYEFPVGVLTRYRLRRFNGAGTEIGTTTPLTITPVQTGVWFKSITRPFLNREVNVIDCSDITRPARNGVFEIIGRTYPIAVTDVRLSRRWSFEVMTQTVSDADALEYVFASGDPLYIQVPPDGKDIPGGYVVVDDVTRNRFGKKSTRRYFTLPMIEVAPPGPDVVGSTVNWEALIAEFGTWTDVLAAFGTWADILDYVASPESVIVP